MKMIFKQKFYCFSSEFQFSLLAGGILSFFFFWDKDYIAITLKETNNFISNGFLFLFESVHLWFKFNLNQSIMLVYQQNIFFNPA